MSQQHIHQHLINNYSIPPFGITGSGQTHTYGKHLPPFNQTAKQLDVNQTANSQYLEEKQNGEGNEKLERLLEEKKVVIDLTGSNGTVNHQQVEKSQFYRANAASENQKQHTMLRFPPPTRNAISGYQIRNPQDQMYAKQVIPENTTAYTMQNVQKIQNTRLPDQYYLPEQAHRIVQNRPSVNAPVRQGQGQILAHRSDIQNPRQGPQISQSQMAHMQAVSDIHSNSVNPQINFQGLSSGRMVQKHPRSYENPSQDQYPQSYMSKQVYPKQTNYYQGLPQETRHGHVSFVGPRIAQVNLKIEPNSTQPQPNGNMRTNVKLETPFASQGIQTRQSNLKIYIPEDQIGPILVDSQHPMLQKQFLRSQIPLTTPKPSTITDIPRPESRGVHDINSYYHPHQYAYQPVHATIANEINVSSIENIYVNAANAPSPKSYQENEKREINQIKESLIAYDKQFNDNQPLLTAVNPPTSEHRIARNKRAEEIYTSHPTFTDRDAKESTNQYAANWAMPSQDVLRHTQNNMPTYRDEKVVPHHNMAYGNNTTNYRQGPYQYNNESPPNQVVPTTNTSIQSSPSSHKNNDSPGADLVKRRREDDQTYEDFPTKLNHGRADFEQNTTFQFS